MAMKNCPYCAEEIREEAVKCRHCGSWIDQSAPPVPGAPSSSGVQSKRLTRSATERMFAGVCGGIGRSLQIDPTLIRIAYVLLTIFTGVIPGIVVYILLCIIIPLESQT